MVVVEDYIGNLHFINLVAAGVILLLATCAFCIFYFMSKMFWCLTYPFRICYRIVIYNDDLCATMCDYKTIV